MFIACLSSLERKIHRAGVSFTVMSEALSAMPSIGVTQQKFVEWMHERTNTSPVLSVLATSSPTILVRLESNLNELLVILLSHKCTLYSASNTLPPTIIPRKIQFILLDSAQTQSPPSVPLSLPPFTSPSILHLLPPSLPPSLPSFYKYFGIFYTVCMMPVKHGRFLKNQTQPHV